MCVEEFYRTVFALTDEGLVRFLTDLTQVRTIPKGGMLIQEEIVFLVDGILRGYYMDMNGKEVTDCFGFYPGTPAVACLQLNVPSTVSIMALCDTVVCCLPTVKVMEQMDTNVPLIKLYNQLLQATFQKHWEVKTMMTQFTAVQRYHWFLDRYPTLIDRVNHKYIASFLGMSPVSLSRLRKSEKEE